MRVHKGTALIAGVAALALGLAACSSSGSGGSGGGSGSPTTGSSSTGSYDPAAGTKGAGNLANCATEANTCNSGTAGSGGTISYVLEKTLYGWNPLNANAGTFEGAEVMDGLFPVVFNAGPDLKPFLNKDLMVSATQTSTSPQTLVYKIQPNAVWNDGTPINYQDFLYTKDANDGTTCPAKQCEPASTSGYDQIKTMTSSDGGKTVTVVMKTPFSDWESMFGDLLPEHVAAKQGNLKTAAGQIAASNYFNKTRPTWSGGPMEITGGNLTQSITEKPNPKWYGATKSKLKQLVFRVITDQTQEPTALQNNEVQAIYPQPTQDLVQQVDQNQNVSSYQGKGLTWEHFDFNEKNVFLKDKALRLAMFTAISRQQLIARTVGTFVSGLTPLGNHMYVPGQAGYQDNVTSTGQGSGNIAKAKAILQKAGYTGIGSTLKTPSGQAVHFRCTYSAGNSVRQTECQIAQNAGQQLGIKISLVTSTDLSQLASGDFDMIVFAWVGTPFVTSGAQQIWELKGGSDFGSNNDPTVEKDINEAATSTSASKTIQLMNAADKKLTADAYVLPLYQKPTFLAIDNNLVNIRDNATSVGPPYNVQEWGVKAS
ncbi:ABC transporter family substrate-binding protein [Jatrophihabitans endophyticus]|uniref:ABC transporter family substrate-binding protein n=1 Tax=Jatrophihabitans endophyticus TaxID=1206085 RepID=UPI0019E858C4|nr:ABC transporter family substrate-binding protein [Jatrophihabitans endophyticus]MBE7187275.1 ABC transporter family substrate-binding protein [Jatrophihabitans endophyticus]